VFKVIPCARVATAEMDRSSSTLWTMDGILVYTDSCFYLCTLISMITRCNVG